MDIDGNKKALGANDAKFFMLSLNPSQSEQIPYRPEKWTI